MPAAQGEESVRRRWDRLFIAGEWVAPHSGRMIESIDPSTETIWAEVAEADEIDVDAAVTAAMEAMRGVWAHPRIRDDLQI